MMYEVSVFPHNFPHTRLLCGSVGHHSGKAKTMRVDTMLPFALAYTFGLSRYIAKFYDAHNP